MQTQTGMLARTIHEDRVRGYADRARLDRFEARTATSGGELIRSLIRRASGSPSRPAPTGSIATASRS